MGETKKIEVMESVYAKNIETAEKIQKEFDKNGVFAINVMGAPGVGKTSSLIEIIKRVESQTYVIEGDIESSIDTQKLRSLGINAAQVNTGGACHLDSPLIEKACAEIMPKDGVLFIENIGNLVCPAEFVIGEHKKMLITSVTDGSDKPYKYPLAFEKADIILINKMDIAMYVDFDKKYFLDGIKKLNPAVPVFEVSCKTGKGFDEVAEWIEQTKSSFIKK